MTIHPAVVKFDRDKARDLYRDYKKHLHYAKPVDREIGRAYQLLSQGRLIIRLFDSIKTAGLNPQSHPVLAIARADWPECFCTVRHDGSAIYSATGWPRSNSVRYDLPPGTFQREAPRRAYAARTVPPVIPLNVRPKRGLQNYAILWEAEWTPVPPKDPLLLRQVGRSDLWLVVAQWDLTEVERAVLATRIRA
jgi:hypothetical protein